mmetsp:Transcript_39340/g.121665  ORF Transcript_39340/g.121665 Transcript_39340/m.121665 type:complete len:205 (+) Transcript_39340:694-1308(+)
MRRAHGLERPLLGVQQRLPALERCREALEVRAIVLADGAVGHTKLVARCAEAALIEAVVVACARGRRVVVTRGVVRCGEGELQLLHAVPQPLVLRRHQVPLAAEQHRVVRLGVVLDPEALVLFLQPPVAAERGVGVAKQRVKLALQLSAVSTPLLRRVLLGGPGLRELRVAQANLPFEGLANVAQLSLHLALRRVENLGHSVTD